MLAKRRSKLWKMIGNEASREGRKWEVEAKLKGRGNLLNQSVEVFVRERREDGEM